MEFKIQTSELRYVTKLLATSVESNTTEPAGRILIEARKNDVLFLVNDGSVVLEYISENCDVKTEGKTSIVFTDLSSFILPFNSWNERFGSKETTFKVIEKAAEKYVQIYVDNTLENGSNFDGELKLDVWDTYSILKPKPFGKADFILNCALTKTAVSKVLYAVNPQEVREYLQNIKVEFDKNLITFVGTNGIVLSEFEMNNVSGKKDGGFTVKYDFMSAFEKVLPKDDTQLFLETTESKIKAKFNNVFIEGGLNIGREYPQYKSTLEAFSDTIKLNKKMILDVLIPMQGILSPDDHFRLTIELKKGKLNLYNDNVKFKSSLKLDHDADFIIDVNGKLLKRTIESIMDEELLMKFSDDKGVLVFDSAGFENQKSLMTPIRRR